MTPEPLSTDTPPVPENPFEAQLQQAKQAPASLEPAPPSRRRSRWPLLLLLLPILGIGGYFYKSRREADALYRRNRAPIVLPDRMARVPAEWSVKTLGERLQEKRKIRDVEAFREAAAQVGLKTVTPGSYFLPAQASPLDLARAFQAGPTHRDVTFPEGFTSLQFVARLRKNGFVGAQKMEQIPPAQLEGKLFPATYEVPIRGDSTTLIALFQERWKQEMAKLPRPFPKINGKELTLMEVVTLASLVEREAASRAEMPLVAGVMVGRLRKPMRLQIDASIQYARVLANQGHKGRLLYEDLEINSPYNTYRNDGLPPTPICNPGEAALRAAARPASTDALFYVYSPKLKRHLFARDYSQHLRYVDQVRRERTQLEQSASGA